MGKYKLCFVLYNGVEKHVKFGEQLQLEKDQRYAKMMVKQKELENFKEKHEEIFQTERNEANAQIIKLNQEKEHIEKTLGKKLSETTNALETLEGELEVRKMQINIEKIKLENDQAEVQEKIQETELYYQDQMLELKKLQLKQQKDAKLIKLLTDHSPT